MSAVISALCLYMSALTVILLTSYLHMNNIAVLSLCHQLSLIGPIKLFRLENGTVKIFHDYFECVELMSDSQFYKDFRMPKGHFQLLHEKLVTTEAFHCTSPGKPPVDSEKCLCIALWVLANQDSYRSIASRFAVSKSTVVQCTRRVISGLLTDVCKNAIRLPNTENEKRKIAEDFEDIAGFQGVLGAIDGCQIQIKAPSRPDKHTYFDRKKKYSLLLQGLCDANCFFTNVDIRWPGSVHDAKAFATSDLYPLCQELCGNEYHFLGDAAYPLSTFLMRPYRRTHRLNMKQKVYNKVLSKSRQVIERSFGFLKNKWRRMFFLYRVHIEEAVSTILACCVLHNICLASEEYATELIFGPEIEENQENYEENVPQENANQKRVRITNELWNTYN